METNTIRETIDLKTETLIGTDQAESDSHELSFDEIETYSTANDSECDEIWEDDEEKKNFYERLDENMKLLMGEWIEDRIKKRLDDHGEINIGEREVALDIIYKRINTDISQDIRNEFISIAHTLMADLEEYRSDFLDARAETEAKCHISYFMHCLTKNMYKDESSKLPIT